MPELPEVETVAQGLRRTILRKKLKGVEVFLPKTVRHGDLRDLVGRTVRRVDRVGKLMLLRWSGEMTLLWHLKMTGQILLARPAETLVKHTHLRFSFNGLDLRFVDLRQFGYVKLVPTAEAEAQAEFRALGPDALGLDHSEFLERIRGRRGRIKPLLLNQSFIAGIGNIYADESLFRAGIHPLTPASDLSHDQRRRLFGAINDVLTEALSLGGSSISRFCDVHGKLGYFQTRHQVYRRHQEACPACGSVIERFRLGGRGTHFCPQCQKV
ncbi:MAG: bifunctional DNA-formamidopyrimidine glycosylase/DNA-(apurinic or apyrimidinic site) lyase [Proteobacteria bacterium]|nr:bifunctional DNA-formamidopyrimidine glycosylase/DNA-(apurinic or apyrimidinic site) lyase [Pseudomonadota bacterium]MBU1741895.1 bifunctional DNA-formamidopyrimidine glycosylase/DNA-(apurinic or apyrimidinic site) lyase [Pseudomonadota bacterium]